jgi:hypothetical protein
MLTDWISLVSGVASVVLSSMGAIRKKPLPQWAWWTAAAICFLLAPARIWTTEHRRANRLQVILDQQVNPQLACTIDQISQSASGQNSQANSVLISIVTLRNTGAPSAADSYSLRVKLLDGSEVSGLLLTIPERLPITYPNGFTRTLKSDQALYNKTVTPVGHNEIRRGFLMFQLTGLSPARLSAAVKSYDLYVKDITGRDTSCTRMPDQSGPKTNLSFPGLDDSN